ncbi:MAG: hypothetical protein ACRD3O_04555, partial [Terriglobia bacterium]
RVPEVRGRVRGPFDWPANPSQGFAARLYKEAYLRTLGVRLLRVPNALVLENPEKFLRKVQEAIG